ncbi:MAG: FTR1 family protein [Mariprofundaceae bacterium]
MIAAWIIVFRETLEMALVLGVLLAATQGASTSRRWIAGGAAGGALGAVLAAVFMEELENALAGDGEFVFNAVVLAAAAALIGWTVVWMARHGREMSARMKQVGQAVSNGAAPKAALAAVSFAAVLREGGEAVFFLFGAARSIADDGSGMLIGGVLGLASGGLTGWAVYKGLARIPLRHLFRVIGWLLTLMAAGMAALAAANLVLIGWLPPLADPLWDTSAILSEDSAPGAFLRVLTGYSDTPSGMQMLVFGLTLALIAIAHTHANRPRQG